MTSRMQRFLDGETVDYLIPDIERLIALRPQGPKGLGGCTVATGMFLFVIMDFIGYLCRADTRKPKLDDTKGNLKALFHHPLSDLPREYSGRLDTLVSLFRHGMMHQIFPKAAGIRKAGRNVALFQRLDGLDHLNVDRMGHDVIIMLKRFQQGLTNDPQLDRQMSERLDRLSSTDFTEMGHKRKAEQGSCG